MEGATVEELLAYIFGIYIKFSKKIHFELNSMEFGLSCNIAWVTSEQFVIIETPIIMHFYFQGYCQSIKVLNIIAKQAIKTLFCWSETSPSL